MKEKKGRQSEVANNHDYTKLKKKKKKIKYGEITASAISKFRILHADTCFI